MIRFVLTTLVAGILANVALPSLAQQLKVDARCELHYRDTIVGEGPCTATQDGDNVNVKGTISENGKNYLAIINNRSNYGTLIGAGTFPLAEGKLVANDSTRVIFDNYYELDIILPSGGGATVNRSSNKGAAAALIGALFAGAVISATQNDGGSSTPAQSGNTRTDSFESVCGVIQDGQPTRYRCTVEDIYENEQKVRTILRYPDITFEVIWGQGNSLTLNSEGVRPIPGTYATSEGETDIITDEKTWFYYSDKGIAEFEVRNFQP
jgi:hypothetical protein